MSKFKLLAIFTLMSASLFSQGVKTEHKAVINGREIAYTAEAGKLPLKDNAGKLKGELFYVSYLKQEEGVKSRRPVTFCFNGGPGSSSVWLHIGMMGPKRINIAKGTYAPPYEMEDNAYSLLDITDLVFIDPVSTGFSQPAPEQDVKQFHGVDEDVEAVSNAICYWLSENRKWDAPKYLAGESYGTTRAAALALKLHDDEYCYLNGIILISSVLDYQTIPCFGNSTDLPYVLMLPSYTQAAAFHHKLADELIKDPAKRQKEVEAFALNVYGPALLKGDLLPEKEKADLIEKLSYYTGLSTKYIAQSNLRVPLNRFAKELLRDDKWTVGRFDARNKGIESDETRCVFEYDPSFERVAGPFSGSFNQYVRTDLNWEPLESYRILADVHPWNWGRANNSFLNVGNQLREVMSKNPELKVFVASGSYDLATPYFATEYTFNHLNLAPSQKVHTVHKVYPGGHMMYLDEDNLKQLKEDLRAFY